MSIRSAATSLKRILKSFLSRNEALALTYHSVLPTEVSMFSNPYHIRQEQFYAHMDYLAKNGYNCVSLLQLADYLNNKKLPPKTVTISFDDGFYNNLSVALPILKHFGIPATVFVATGFLGGIILHWPEKIALMIALSTRNKLNIDGIDLPIESDAEKLSTCNAISRHFKQCSAEEIESTVCRLLEQTHLTEEDLHASSLFDAVRFMTWEEAALLKQSRIVDIGSHTVSHRRLIHVDPVEARGELVESRRIIKHRIGECTSFAFPYGIPGTDFSSAHMAMAAAAGYQIICSVESIPISASTDTKRIPRFCVLSEHNVSHLDYFLNGGISLMEPGTLPVYFKRLFLGRG